MDAWRQLGWNLPLAQIVFAAGMLLELGAFIAVIRLIAAAKLDLYLVLALVLTLCLAALGTYWSRYRFLTLAMEYERSLATRLLKLQLPAPTLRDAIARDVREIATLLRHWARLPVHLGAALPVVAALFWLAPGLTVLVSIILLSSTLPLSVISRAAARRMQALHEANRAAAEERSTLLSSVDSDNVEAAAIYENSPLRQAQDSYQSMLATSESSQLVSGLSTVAVIGVILFFFLQGTLDIETAVIYTVGARFLMAQLGAIAGAMTAMNRFYGALGKIRRLVVASPTAEGLLGEGDETAKPVPAATTSPQQRIEVLKGKLGEARQAFLRKSEANEILKQRIKTLQEEITKVRAWRVDRREIDPIQHNTAESMDDFFSTIEDEAPYVQFGQTLRNLISLHGVDLDGASVLDFGTGPGVALKAVVNGWLPRRVVGYDFSERALEFARSYYPQAEFSVCDIYVGNDEAFDFVLCSEVLEHLQHPERALATLFRMTNSGGTLLITVPDGRMDVSRYHINFWSPESWRSFIERWVAAGELETGTFKLDADAPQQYNFAIVRMPS